MSDHPISYKPAELGSLLDVHPREYGYSIPGHFVRWLLEWRGSETFVEFFRDGDFEAAYGMDVEAVEQIYDAEAAMVLPPPFACEDEPLLAGPDGSFELDVDLDCENGTSTRLPPGYEPIFLAESRIIDVVQPTTFSLIAEGGYEVVISGSQSTAGERVDQLGDVANETAPTPPGPYTYFEAEVEHEVFLPAWKYRIYLVTLDEPARMRLRLRPK